MNVDEFLNFVGEVGSIMNLPVHPFRKKWAKITSEIEPHYYGEIPGALEKTFPNEDEDVFKYRQDTYQPKTEACIVDAINKLSRLLQDSKYSIKFENNSMEQYINQIKTIAGDKVTDWFLSKFVSKRMLDPNAVLVVWPKGEGITNNRMEVDFDLDFIESKDIEFIDFELGLLIYKAPARTKYQTITGFEVAQEYKKRIITNQFYGEITFESGKDNIDDNGVYKLNVIYEHKMNYLPFVVMGGRPLTKEYRGYQYIYYESDITPAIPYLNDAATSDNQHKSVLNANCFPVKIMQGIDCNKCHGSGQYRNPTPEDPDRIVTCGTCKGSGEILHNSPLKGIYLRKSDGDDSNVKPIEFISPNVSTIDLVGKYADDKLQQAKEVLNIDKAIRYAQSGIAKELDNAPEYIEVKRIADQIFYKLNIILYSIQGLRFMDLRNQIMVIPPTSFNIKTETELYAEFQATLTGKAPDFVRAAAFQEWVKSRFSTDKVGQRIADLCIMYSPLYLYTIEERKEQYLLQTANQNDLVRAAYGFGAIMEMYSKDHQSIYRELAEIESELDAILQPRFELAAVNELPEIDPNLAL
jgi:hypothetical protein